MNDRDITRITVVLDDFLEAFYHSAEETIWFRTFKPKGAPETAQNGPRKISFCRNQLAAEYGERKLHELNRSNGIYFVPNAGGNTDDEIVRFSAVFVENDKLSIPEQHAALDRAPMPTSIRVETKRSVHGYWLLSGACNSAEWREFQVRLIGYFDGDPSIKNPSRVMRLPFFNHLTYSSENGSMSYEAKPVRVVQFDPDRRYSIAQLNEAFPCGLRRDVRTEGAAEVAEIVGNGSRNSTLFSLAGTMRRRGLGENEILAALREVNVTRVRPELADSELAEIARNAVRYSPAEATSNGHLPDESPTSDLPSFPELPNAALYGVAGDLIRMIGPHTESDSAALLAQFLAGFGCLIGRTSHFWAEADQHFTKVFAVIVGSSSKGRKGTSWGYIKRVLSRVDESFANCVQDGLSSGEGLIAHVRDAQTKKTPIRQKGRIVEYQDEIVDEGSKEKRALILEPEFARVLRVMQREGNTLSSRYQTIMGYRSLAGNDQDPASSHRDTDFNSRPCNVARTSSKSRGDRDR